MLLRCGATVASSEAPRRWRLRWLLIQEKNSDGADPASHSSRARAAIRDGRRPGARNRTCALALKLMDADAEPVILALIKAAKSGDVAAIKLVLERVAPLPRNRPVQFAHAAYRDLRRSGRGDGRHPASRRRWRADAG